MKFLLHGSRGQKRSLRKPLFRATDFRLLQKNENEMPISLLIMPHCKLPESTNLSSVDTFLSSQFLFY